MKTANIKNIFSVMILASVVGCTDLDVDINSQYTTFPDSDIAAEAVSANVYNSYRGCMGRDHWMMQTLSSDEAMSVTMGTDWYDNGAYMMATLHSWTPDLGMLWGMWSDPMSGITSCNQVLALFNDDESEISAPIRAMRAYYFFLLMDNFGDVPLITSMDSGAQERAPRADVCRYIESELLAIRDKLPENVDATTYGKATRYMADALLAKIYLNWPLYTSANVESYEPTMANPKLNDLVKVCDDVIQSNKFDLGDGYMVKFRPDNGAHIKDFIFVMPYDREKQQGMTYARFWICRSAQKQFGALPNSVGGVLRCLPEFYDKFNLPGDERNNMYVTGKQYYWENYKETDKPFTISTSKKGIDQDYTGDDGDDKFDWQLELTKEITIRDDGWATLNTGNDQKGRCCGYRSIKFYMDVETTKDQGRNQSNDVPIFRYADILLMKAEAILKGAAPTNGQTAESLINQIRTYVGAPALASGASLELLLDERAREFADEGWRRNDLIRFGMFEDEWGFKYDSRLPEDKRAKKEDKYRRIFPIHTDILNTNTNWKQNSKY